MRWSVLRAFFLGWPLAAARAGVPCDGCAGAVQSAAKSLAAEPEGWKIAVAVIGVLAVFGAFGGMLAAWSHVPITDILKRGFDKTYSNWARLRGITVLGALWGAGGGLVFGVVLYLDGKFRELTSFDGERFIFFACAAVAAGFSGIRLLRLVSGNLEDKVNQAGQKADAAEKKADAAEKKADEFPKLAGALSFAGHILDGLEADRKKSSPPAPVQPGSALAESDETSIKLAIEMLDDARKAFPQLRLVGIYLGRLHKALSNYPEGIRTLTQVYEARSEPRNKDDAALLFNRACYQNMLRLISAAPKDQQKLLDAAQADLNESIRLDPENAAAAKGDRELRGLNGGPLP